MISNEMLFRLIETQQSQIGMMTKCMSMSLEVITGLQESILKLYELNGIPTDPKVKAIMEEVKQKMAKISEMDL
jgi:hypothetical protein